MPSRHRLADDARADRGDGRRARILREETGIPPGRSTSTGGGGDGDGLAVDPNPKPQTPNPKPQTPNPEHFSKLSQKYLQPVRKK